MDRLNRLSNFRENGHLTTVFFKSETDAEMNLYRRAILSEIETYCIDIVIFDINTSARHDEILALRLGQLVIDHSRFEPPEEGDFRAHIDFSGPGTFTTEHIPDLPFKYVTPIAQLRPGQRIMCDVIVRQGIGKTHVKWRPVTTVTWKKLDGGFDITITDIGMLSGREIFELGLDKIKAASQWVPTSPFTHPVIPKFSEFFE